MKDEKDRRFMKETILSMFKIRPGEGKAVWWMLLHSFFTGIASIYLGTASYALFLTQFDVKILPVVYIISSIIVAMVGVLYSRLQEHFSFAKLFSSTLLILALSILFLWGSLKFMSSKSTVMGVIICYNVMIVLTGLEFWGLAGHLFNVRQGKRLFGLIGSGMVAAAFIGGTTVSGLVKWIGAANLLIISASGMFLSLGALIFILKQFRRSFTSDEEDSGKVQGDGRSVFQEKYLVLIFILASLSILAYYMMDYIFYNQIETRYTGEAEVAGFIGWFFAAFRIVTLVSSTFVYGGVISRFGLSAGLLTVPGVMTLGSAAAVLIGFFLSTGPLFFKLVVGIKLLDNVCRLSIEEPSFRILYQPISPARRMKFQTMLETIVEPSASALSGGALLLFTNVLKFDTLRLFHFMCGIVVIWIIAAVLLRKEYTRMLTDALSNRKLGGSALSLNDASSRDVLRKGLDSPSPEEVIYCLNMLEEIEHDELEDYLTSLVDHPEPRVRRYVLERIEAAMVTKARPRVIERLEKEISPVVTGTILRTLCALSDTDAFEKVFPYLDDPNLEIRKGAMTGLLKNGGIDGILSAGGKLNTLLISNVSEQRCLAAQILGEVGIAGFHRPLVKLLMDERIDVQKQAIIAAGKLKNLKLLPILLEKFSKPELCSSAVSAVMAFGPDVLPELENTFENDTLNRNIRTRIVKIIGKIGGKEAINILREKIDFAEEDIRTHILSALVHCKYRASGREIRLIHDHIENEIADAAWTLSALVDIGKHETIIPLRDSLENEITKNKDRIFLLLAMVYPQGAIMNAMKQLNSRSSEIRANALEALDNMLPQEITSIFFPLLDDIPPTQRHARLVSRFPQERKSRHERIKEILTRSHHWTRAWTKICALHAIGKIATREFFDATFSALSDPDEVVRETAVWAMGCLNPDDLIERLQPMLKDRSEKVARYARFVINSVGFSRIPEKSGYLTRSGKYTVDLFKNILDDDGERRARRCRAAAILSQFRNEAAVNALLESLTVSDKSIRSAILDALVKIGAEIKGSRRNELLKLLQMEIRDAGNILEAITVFLTERNSERLVQALSREVYHTRKRTLSILTLLSEKRENHGLLFYWYIYQSRKKPPQTVGSQLNQMLSGIPEIPLRKRLFTLLNFRRPDSLKNLSGKKIRASSGTLREKLKLIAFGSEIYSLSWTRICAVEVIVSLQFFDFAEKLDDMLNETNEAVRATAIWAISKLHPNRFASRLERLKSDPSPLVFRTVKQLEKERDEQRKHQIINPVSGKETGKGTVHAADN